MLKRVRSLLVPFWLWSIIIFVVHVVIAYMIHQTGYQYGGEDSMDWRSLKGFLLVSGLYLYDEMPTMWFMRTLFVFVLLSPLIFSCRRFGIVVLAALYFCMQ